MTERFRVFQCSPKALVGFAQLFALRLELRNLAALFRLSIWASLTLIEAGSDPVCMSRELSWFAP